MNEEEISKKKLTINEFKSQVGCMLKAITQLDSGDRNEAFGFLVQCVNGLEPEDDSGRCSEDVTVDEKITKKKKNDTSNSPESLDNSSSNGNNIKKNFQLTCTLCKKEFLSLNSLYSHGKQQHTDLLSCKTCRETFSDKQFHDVHKLLKLCSKTDVFACTFCNKTYKNLQHYTLHTEGHKRNKCNDCEIYFPTRKLLEKHTQEVHKKQLKNNKFKCQLCDGKFAQKRSLLNHYKLIHSEGHNICFICGSLFASNEELTAHKETHVIKTFICQLCNEKFSRKQQYLVHLKDHDKYKCLTCNKSYSNKKKLEEHELEGHTIDGLVAQYQCETCGSTFHFQTNLYAHEKSHSSEKVYGCTRCKLIFKDSGNYKQHFLFSAAHLENECSEIFECSDCGKVFTMKAKLQNHRVKYHKKESYCCEYCDFKTESEFNLKRHIKLHVKKKEFICEKCGDTFHTKSALSEHCNYIHSDEKNYSCEKCGLTFKMASVLNRHMLCHGAERKYVCHCGQSYKFKWNLRRHQLSIHGEAGKSKRVKRLITDDDDDCTSTSPGGSKKKKKRGLKGKEKSDEIEEYNALMNSQTPVSVPVINVSAPHTTILLPNSHQDTQMMQVSYHDMNYSTDKSHLVYAQSLDMTNLHVVETILQSEESLKNESSVLVDSLHHTNLFSRQISDAETNGFLHSDNLIHPPIEPSLVTSLGEPLNSSDQLTSPSQQNIMNSLPDYLPHSFPFLNM